MSSRRFERQIRVDRACAIAEQQGKMVHFTRFAGLDKQADFGPSALTDQMVMQA
jgi:hypothetical protein